MSTAYPRFDAIEDSSIGLSGGHLRVPYIIELDAVGDDPYTPLIAAAPLGSAPNIRTRTIRGSLSGTVANRFSGLVVVEYESPRLLNEKTFQAFVVYGPASDRTIGLWRRSIRFASETKPFDWSLPETDEAGHVTTPSQRVGSYDYAVMADQSLGSNYVATVKQGGTNKTLNVEPTGFTQESNASSNDGITSFVYEILIPQLTPLQVRKISALKWHTNKFDWNGYSNWTLIFANWESHDEVIVLPGSRPTAFWYSNVSVEILYREIDPDRFPFGWRAVRLNEHLKLTSGTVPVFDVSNGIADRVSSRTFIQYHQVAFDTLFGLFGTGSPLV